MQQADKWEEEVPEWLASLSPGLGPKEALEAAKEWSRCAQDLRTRTRKFLQQAWAGAPCRVLDEGSGKGLAAEFELDEQAMKLTIKESEGPDRFPLERSCSLADIRNIWVCADSALARRWHGAIVGMCDADLSCLVLLDLPAGPLGLVLRNSEAREDFLDCLAVLIAMQRLKSERRLALCELPRHAPPPEARLRYRGRSLQSAHLSGPICTWLARIGEEVLKDEVAAEGGLPAKERVAEIASQASPHPPESTGGTTDHPRNAREASYSIAGSQENNIPVQVKAQPVSAWRQHTQAIRRTPSGRSQEKAPPPLPNEGDAAL